MTHARLLCLSLVLLLILGRALAAEPTLNEQLEAVRVRNEIPALAGLIIENDTVVAEGAVGLRAVGSPEAVTTTDLWHIGSCTKAMTATLCARLIERGKLSWSTTVADAFPSLKNDMHEQWSKVTIEQLLANRAGAPTDLRTSGLWAKLWALNTQGAEPRRQRRELLLGIMKEPPSFEPGSKFEYSNTGFALAGHIAETIMDEPYESLIRREVFEPLGMKGVGFGAAGSATAVTQPRGHTGQKPPYTPVTPGPSADNPQVMAPAGTIHLPLADWARFAAAHAQGHTDEGAAKGFLKIDTWNRLHTALGDEAPADGYAMGWGITRRPWAKGAGENDVGKVLTHGGSNTMSFAVVWIAPEKNLAILAVTNAAGPNATKAADEAIGVLMKQRPKGP